jgi:hypothetical protein
MAVSDNPDFRHLPSLSPPPAGMESDPPAGYASPNGTPRSSSWTRRAPCMSVATERSLPRRANASKVDRGSGYTSDARTSSAA